MIARSLVEAGDQVRAAGACGAGADAEPAGELGLSGGGQRRAFFMPHADPFDPALAHRVAERIQRVSDQSEDLLHTNFFENFDENFRDGFRHAALR